MHFKLAGMMLLATGIAQASPTANEFRPCHAVAGTVLEQCLNEHDSEECWDKARAAKADCYKRVFKQHAPLTPDELRQREEQRRADEEMKEAIRKKHAK